MDTPHADLIVVDEAHHIRARTYADIMARYPDAIVIGLTATPCRGDGRGLGNAFEVIVECPAVSELIAWGYLVPPRIYAPSQPDLEGLAVARGDYVESQLAERVDTPALVGDVATHWHRHGEGRRTVVFATGVAHSLHLRDELCRSGAVAEHIDGSTPADERDAILAKLAAGSIDVVCNAMVLTEGWDCPEVGCLILARPTRNLGLYRQMVGRVLRPAPGKTDAIILDHAGAVFAHGFPDDPITWSLAEDTRAENKVHRSRTASHSTRLQTCPECAGVRMQGRPCPCCGWRPRALSAPIETIDGDLQHVAKGSGPKGKIGAFDPDAFQAQLAWIAREKGYQSGWVAHKFKEKFGVWPRSKFVQPVPPDSAMRSWIRSRQIAFAKSASRRRAS